MRANTVANFWRKVKKQPGDKCWLWLAAKDQDGYGLFQWRKTVRAARFVVGVILGVDIQGLEVCHTCDNPSCVRPSHLFVGTQLDNAIDRNIKGRHCHGERHHAAMLTEATACEAIIALLNGANRRILANALGVTKSCIEKLAARRSWKHLWRVLDADANPQAR